MSNIKKIPFQSAGPARDKGKNKKKKGEKQKMSVTRECVPFKPKVTFKEPEKAEENAAAPHDAADTEAGPAPSKLNVSFLLIS